ncbi:hypothetical protein WDW86_22250 [Bdellovibrionota bacterium FG-2]
MFPRIVPSWAWCWELWDHNSRGEYRTASNELDQATSDSELSTAEFLTKQNRYNETIRPLMDLQASMSNLLISVGSLYKEYAALEGGTGQILYTLDWARLVTDYASLTLVDHKRRN